jgi:hypothetical protein
MQQPDDKVSLQDGIAALSVCRRVVCKLDEKLPAAARQVNESRAQILAARASVSQRLFRLIDTRARASVSQSEVIALRQIVEQLKTTVKVWRSWLHVLLHSLFALCTLKTQTYFLKLSLLSCRRAPLRPLPLPTHSL